MDIKEQAKFYLSENGLPHADEDLKMFDEIITRENAKYIYKEGSKYFVEDVEINQDEGTYNFKNLKACIRYYSESKYYWKAKEEWDVEKFEKRDEWTNCVCDHRIKERVMIKNKINGHTLIIGNTCVEQFNSKKMDNQLKKERLRRCDICNKEMDYASLEKHFDSKGHRNRIEEIKRAEQEIIRLEKIEAEKRIRREEEKAEEKIRREKIKAGEKIRREKMDAEEKIRREKMDAEEKIRREKMDAEKKERILNQDRKKYKDGRQYLINKCKTCDNKIYRYKRCNDCIFRKHLYKF